MKIFKTTIVSISIVLGLILIGLFAEQITRTNLDSANLIMLSDHLDSIEKSSTKGHRGFYDVILIKLNSSKLKFRIQDENIQLTDMTDLLATPLGTAIQIQVLQEQLSKAKKDPWYSTLVKWTVSPEIVSLKIGEKQIYTLNQFKRLNKLNTRKSHKRALILSAFLLIVIFIRLRPSKKSNTGHNMP